MKPGEALFLDFFGKTIPYIGEEIVYPVFIGEAAYKEKKIAMSFTNKEVISCDVKWIENFLNFSFSLNSLNLNN